MAGTAGSAPVGRLEVRGGLDQAHIAAIQELENACGVVDGGRLKLEYGALRDRSPDKTDDFLWFDGDELVGFLGLYGMAPEVEICGMVHPERRREGIFTRLLDAAMAETVQRGASLVMLIVDRQCAPGVAFAAKRQGDLLRSEYRMGQTQAPPMRPEFAPVRLRASTEADYAFMLGCLERAFGNARDPDPTNPSPANRDRLKGQLVVEWEGETVGVMTVEREGAGAGIYGFAVVPERQGQGIGRAALTKATNDVRAEGVEHVFLEVLVDNPRALHLYESCGFEVLGVEDYYVVRS